MKLALVLTFLFMMVSSCDQRKTPEGALKSFVESRFDGGVTRDYVLGRVTGRMRESLEKLPKSEFTKHSELRSINKDSFKVLTKECVDTKCSITYSASYKTSQAEKTSFVTDVQKRAELQLVDGLWLIADVNNLKTVHEAVEPINPLE